MEPTEAQLLDVIKSYINMLQGIELLEYEDKNFLAGDNKSRAEEKIELLRCMQRNIVALQRLHQKREGL